MYFNSNMRDRSKSRNQKEKPKILLANTRSAVRKIEIISSILTRMNVDIFVATETWISYLHSDDFVSIAGWLQGFSK